MMRLDCDQLMSKLDELIDGNLSEVDEAAARAHLDSCESCRAEVDLGIGILESARSLPRSIEPDRDLWPEIVDAIREPNVVRGPFTPPPAAPVRGWLKIAAAAAVLIASMTIAYMAGFERAQPQMAEAPPVENDYALAAYDGVSNDLEAARNLLRSGLEQRRDELSPETWSVVMDNLSVIDQAIARIETAMKENPGDGRLNRQLATAYRRQIDLLQRATRLPTEA